MSWLKRIPVLDEAFPEITIDLVSDPYPLLEQVEEPF